MKIRTGYVSNSSSSSFCIVGFVVEKDKHFDVNVLSEAEKKELKRFCDEYDDYDVAECLCKNSSLSVECGIDTYCNQYLVGRPISSMHDDETLGKFKKQIFDVACRVGFRNLTIDDIKIHIDGGNYC